MLDEKEMDALANSLRDFNPGDSTSLTRIRNALAKVASDLAEEGDLEKLPDDQLVAIDATAQARLAYAAAYVQMGKYLRKKTAGKESVEQAKVALGFIRHAEATGLKALQIGRSPADGALSEEVAAMRSELTSLAEAKAVILMDKQGNGEKTTQPPAQSGETEGPASQEDQEGRGLN